MNERFVSVKVDREERPDVDSVYMEAVAALTGQGGWPMTVFLTPDGAPFFGGTYYPPEPRHGLPSFRQVLVAISDAYREQRDDVARQAATLVEALQPRRNWRRRNEAADPTRCSARRRARARVAPGHDPRWEASGARRSSRPRPTLEFLLRPRGARAGDA